MENTTVLNSLFVETTLRCKVVCTDVEDDKETVHDYIALAFSLNQLVGNSPRMYIRNDNVGTLQIS